MANAMRVSSSVSTERLRAAFIVVFVGFTISAALAADWYVSDASGMALERSTRSLASRLEYSLSIETALDSDSVPAGMRGAMPSGGTIELRTLYERGEVRRRRWAALDSDGFERLVETRWTDGTITRERYDASLRFVEEARLGADGAGTVIRYFYAGSRLERAEAFAVAGGETPIWTETYRYLRSGALLSVERTKVTPEGEKPSTEATEAVRFDTALGVPRTLVTRSADGSGSRTRYDASGRVAERATLDATGKPVVVAEVMKDAGETKKSAGSIVRSTEAGITVETGLDERSRIIWERRTDEGGALLSETHTVWSENRIASVEIVVGAETRRTEYEYDAAGNRMMERNYRNGALERSVRRSGDEDTEELYSDGVPVLRAVWVGGRKVSERRLRKGEGTIR
jgi:YD repeat-containing protein